MTGYLNRYIEKTITEDLKQKMVFIGGPRQAGKTTLAKYLCKQAGFDPEKRYINWDALEDREKIMTEMFQFHDFLFYRYGFIVVLFIVFWKLFFQFSNFTI